MTVDQLREALASMPGHVPVHVEVPADGSGGGADSDYHFTLECVLEAFPTQGRMAVIRLNPQPN
jgi:hypothetical protein